MEEVNCQTQASYDGNQIYFQRLVKKWDYDDQADEGGDNSAVNSE